MQEVPIAIAAPCIPAPECAGQTDAFRRWNAETAAASGRHTCLPYVYVLSKCIADQRNMKVSEQCRIAASKGNQILGMIRRNITYKEKGLIVPLYKAIVRPHLEYCIQAWRPYLRKDIDILEKVQRRTTKLIAGLRDLSYDDRLKECGLTTLETRRLRGDQIEVFKILNGHENIDPNIFFQN